MSKNNESHPVFTIENGRATPGAAVKTYQINGGNIKIPAIVIGEAGRGRKLGILPVHLMHDIDRAWQERGETTIAAASIGQTHSGKPKLIAATSVNNTDAAIVVFRTSIGFRGSNSHTGDRTGWKCQRCGAGGDFEYPTQDKPKTCPACGADEWSIEVNFAPFPGEILVDGVIAQGIAGRMGSGRQLIAIVPRGVVFRTGYTGRLYGKPSAHYYMFDGKQIVYLTFLERQASDLF